MSSTKPADIVEADAGEGSSSGAASSALAVTKQHAAAAAAAVTPSPAQRKYALPSVVRFFAVVAMSFSISSMGYSFINEFTKGELATVMRTSDTPREVAVMTAWRLAELALGWVANFDSIDLAALNLLSHSPTFYLMTAFYDLSPKTAVAGVTVDVIASFVPFFLMRPFSPAHRAESSTPNREIIVDRPIQILSTMLASFIYSVVLFLSYQTYLRSALVLHFEGIHTVQPTQAGLIALTTLSLVSGIAARSFIFTPLAATGRSEQDEKTAQFDPVEASLGETLWWNIWGYTTQTKVGIARTLAVVAVTGINTYLQCALTISGVETTGAAVYASAWTAAAFFAGVGLGFVGEV